MSRFGAILVCLALVAVVGLSACGGGGDTKTQTGPKDPVKFARALFQFRISKVCAATNDAVKDIQPKSLDEIPAAVPQLVPLLGAQIQAMRAIPLPRGFEQAFSQLLGGLQAQIAILQAIKLTSDKNQGRKKATKLVDQLNVVGTKTQQLAGQMGLQGCGT